MMDKLERYRTILRELIEEHGKYPPSHGEIQVEKIFDESLDHYELIYAGWSNNYRIHGSVLHIDIRNGKIWIQHDGTPDGIALRMVEEYGIPKSDIVLAYKHMEQRVLLDFALE